MHRCHRHSDIMIYGGCTVVIPWCFEDNVFIFALARGQQWRGISDASWKDGKRLFHSEPASGITSVFGLPSVLNEMPREQFIIMWCRTRAQCSLESIIRMRMIYILSKSLHICILLHGIQVDLKKNPQDPEKYKEAPIDSTLLL